MKTILLCCFLFVSNIVTALEETEADKKIKDIYWPDEGSPIEEDGLLFTIPQTLH